MENFAEYLEGLNDPLKVDYLTQIFTRIEEDFPQLEGVIKWNQPMYQHQGTFIIAFSAAKAHVSITPETAGMKPFIDRIEELGYSHTDMLFRVKWKEELNYPLLKDMIEFNLEDKAGFTTFWRLAPNRKK